MPSEENKLIKWWNSLGIAKIGVAGILLILSIIFLLYILPCLLSKISTYWICPR